MDMDLPPPPLSSARLGFEFTDDMWHAFVEWAKMRPLAPNYYHAQTWFREKHDINDVSEDNCKQLIAEAMKRTLESVQARIKMAGPLQVPGFGLPLGHMPPEDQRFPVLVGSHAWDWKAATLLIREVCMLKFIEQLTNKAEWWTKVHDPQIADKWKQEALQFDWTAYRKYADFTPAMADACISELRRKADLYQQTGLIPIFDYSCCVIKSDKLVPEDLCSALRSAVSVLENVPDAEKDWHPGTCHKVLNLVHPSMWPFVYGRTPVLLDKRIGLSDALDHCGMGTVLPQPLPIETSGPGDRMGDDRQEVPSLSNRFQWLPCDVTLDGSSAKIDSYINNLHPVDHAQLYPIIERFIEKALPAWDVIYRWPTEFETQRITTTNARATCTVPDICRRHHHDCQPWNRPVDEGEQENPNAPWEPGYDDSERFQRDMAWYSKTHTIDLPDPTPGDKNHLRLSPSDVKSGGFFNGASRIQVIAKLANIQLTPEDPEFQFEVSQELADWYMAPPGELDRDSDVSSFRPASSEGSPSNSDVSSPGRRPLSVTYSDYHSVYVDNDPAEYEGGSWHSEGMLNERICATALFYYDSDNITDCHLDFRTQANREDLSILLNYDQSQHFPITRTFDIPNTNRDILQYIGGVLTGNSPSTGEGETRSIFFPNTLQHRVSPFRLADPSRPGHRKILALFLVDPAVPVLSTANVPPQRRDWWDREVRIQARLAYRLPAELAKMVLDDLDDFPIDEEGAKKIRLEVIDERSMKQDNTEQYLSWTGYNFCEH